MSFTSRQESFLSLLRQQGEVEVERLAKDWNIATQTVRRDLGVLCHAGSSAAHAWRCKTYQRSLGDGL